MHVNPYKPQPMTAAERNLRRSADRRIAQLCSKPVRTVREHREAFTRMFELIKHTEDYAKKNPGRIGLVIGDGYYVAHNGNHFIARRGPTKMVATSIIRVAMMFDPLQFLSGHLDQR